MSTGTKKKVADPRAAILKELKEHIAEFQYNKERNSYLSAHIYANAYAWVRYTVDSGGASSIGVAIDRLARSLRITPSRCANWYDCGRKMAEHKFAPSKVDAASVRDLAMWGRGLTSHEYAKVVTMIRNGDERSKVRAVVANSRSVTRRRAKSRAQNLMAKGKLNRQSAKLELMGCATFMSRVFEREVVVEVHDAETGQLLLDAK